MVTMYNVKSLGMFRFIIMGFAMIFIREQRQHYLEVRI